MQKGEHPRVLVMLCDNDENSFDHYHSFEFAPNLTHHPAQPYNGLCRCLLEVEVSVWWAQLQITQPNLQIKLGSSPWSTNCC